MCDKDGDDICVCIAMLQTQYCMYGFFIIDIDIVLLPKKEHLTQYSSFCSVVIQKGKF